MAFKNRGSNKKSTKGKKQLWKKGQSSSYNPKFSKHRQEAKKKIGFGGGGEGKLTKLALAQHNKLNANSDILDDRDYEKDPEEISLGEKTFVTSFSECSNPTFSRLLKHWQSNSSLHKEMLAVLAAVTEVLKSNGGKETETEYFAALITALDATNTDEAVTAIVSLLNMVVKKLPIPVLKLQFTKSCKIFVELLVKYMNSEFNALLRNLLGCLYHFLKVQETAAWTDSTLQIYNVLLEFTIHQKPRVRKAAQEAVHTLLRNPSQTSKDTKWVHPAAATTAQFCVLKIENSAGATPSSTLFYILSLMKDIIGAFPKSSLKLCCETVLRAMTLSNAIVTSSCLKTLHGLFLIKPNPENLPADLNARLITALYDYQPSVNDGQLINWFHVMESAFINLYSHNANLCIGHLPNFFKTAVACWLSSKEDIYPVIASTLKNILQGCIDPTSADFQKLLSENPVENPMHKMFHCVEGALSYQFHKAWKDVLVVLASFFDVMGKHFYPVMMKCLQSLADMRGTYGFPCIRELDKALGIAIHKMGPAVVLQAIPLEINGENDKLDFPRSWLLPLLRSHIKETELNFFVRYFLPLASKLRNKEIQYKQENKTIQSKTYDVICSQIWSLLPGFCTEPTDLIQSFKTLARLLGTTLSEQPTLRMTILTSLRILIGKNIKNEENKAEISKFAKNFIPILYNLYTTESKDKREDDVRLAVYDTIKVYIQITDKELCQSLFLKAMEKLKDPNLFTQHALLDLNRAMLPYVDEANVKEFYAYCKPLLQHTQHTIQKKCYSVINELCSSQSESCQLFVKNSLEDLKQLLLTSLSSSASSSKALRLNCLRHIVCHLSEDNKEFIVSVVPEAALCTKETSVKARTAAYKLLIEIGNTLKRWQSNNTKGALRDYMQLLLAGLAGNPHVMSATILAIGQVLYEFKDELDPDIIHLLIENMCLLLTSRSREVVTSALSFVKILFSSVDTSDLVQHIEFLVKNVVSISEDNQRHFRFKAKELFTRLIRKFGYEMIAKLVPDNYQKQLANIRKIEARKMHKKDFKQTGDDDDDDLESIKYKEKSDLIEDILEDSDDELVLEEDTVHKTQGKNLRKQRKSKETAWIEEGAENDIVDFLDPSVNKRILANKPGKVMKTKSVRNFETSDDGRLIIKEEEEDKVKNKKNKEQIVEDADKRSKSDMDTKQIKKRKLADISDDEEAPANYQSVAKGIHRSLETSKGKFGAEYKAKKAGGDIKRGKLDPFAYIPLDPQALNKRKRSKLQGQFSGIVRAAKHGAQKGVKRKAKKMRRRV